ASPRPSTGTPTTRPGGSRSETAPRSPRARRGRSDVSAPRKVLVTGAGGQVGREATELFAAAGWDVTACDRAALDVTSRTAVLEAVDATRPDAVVNLAAWNAVDLAETEPDGAFAANAMAVRFLAEASRQVGARLCHVSTDYVFDGTKTTPYV